MVDLRLQRLRAQLRGFVGSIQALQADICQLRREAERVVAQKRFDSGVLVRGQRASRDVRIQTERFIALIHDCADMEAVRDGHLNGFAVALEQLAADCREIMELMGPTAGRIRLVA